jgi:hypothetical protein
LDDRCSELLFVLALTQALTGGVRHESIQEHPMSHETQSLNRVRDQAQKQVRDLNGFDYNAPAELYPSRIKKGRGRVTYKRFDTAAEALQFAIEQIPSAVLLGAYLEVDEARFGVQEIRFLYDSAGYPLKRAEPQEPQN